MKVLHVLQHSPPNLSGYSIRSEGILQALQGHGVEVAALTGAVERGGKQAIEEIRGVRYYRTLAAVPRVPPPLREWQLSRILSRRLRAVAASERPDLLHVHTPVYNGFAALAVSQNLGIPCVYEMRATMEDAAADSGKIAEGSVLYRAARRLETRLARQVSAVVTICHGLEDDLISRGIPREKLFLAANGVQTSAFEPMARDESLAESLGLQGRLIFGFIGSLFNFEGVEDVLQAAPAVLERYPQTAFLVLGGGERENQVKELVSRLADPRIVYRSRVPHEQVKQYYSIVDCLIYARRRIRLTELVTPLKTLEAMAMEKVVVASNVGGLRELVEHDVTGLLYDQSDNAALAAVLCRVAGDPELRRRLAHSGRDFVVRERSWLRTTESTLRAYHYALGQ